MRILFLLLALFSLSVNACDESDKPHLIIEKDFLDESDDHCGYYLLTLPKKHNNGEIRSIALRHGNDLGFSLSVQSHDDESRSMAAVCASSEWLKNSKLTVTYKDPPQKDGSISLCVDLYEYTNLDQYIESK